VRGKGYGNSDGASRRWEKGSSTDPNNWGGIKWVTLKGEKREKGVGRPKKRGGKLSYWGRDRRSGRTLQEKKEADREAEREKIQRG